MQQKVLYFADFPTVMLYISSDFIFQLKLNMLPLPIMTFPLLPYNQGLSGNPNQNTKSNKHCRN